MHVYRRPFDYAIYARLLNRFIPSFASLSGGVGSASGVATVSGVGGAVVEGIGSSAGVAAVSGVAGAISQGVGVSAGVATVSGVGGFQGLSGGVGSAAGTSTVIGIYIPPVSTSGGTTLSAKISRKDKKRKKKLEQSEKIRLALARVAEQQKRQAEAVKSDSTLKKKTPNAKPEIINLGVEPQEAPLLPFVPDNRLSDNLLLPGETSGFITDAIRRQRIVSGVQIAEQRRLQLLDDDEEVIALYLQHERELIETFLET